MKIMVIHNQYQQAGGEDTVCAAEIALLRQGGHDVIPIIFDNAEIEGRLQMARTAMLTPYNPISRRRIDQAIIEHKPDVVHVHNWFPLAKTMLASATMAAPWTWVKKKGPTSMKKKQNNSASLL